MIYREPGLSGIFHNFIYKSINQGSTVNGIIIKIMYVVKLVYFKSKLLRYIIMAYLDVYHICVLLTL